MRACMRPSVLVYVPRPGSHRAETRGPHRVVTQGRDCAEIQGPHWAETTVPHRDTGPTSCQDSGQAQCRDSGSKLCRDSRSILDRDSGPTSCQDSGQAQCRDSGLHCATTQATSSLPCQSRSVCQGICSESSISESFDAKSIIARRRYSLSRFQIGVNFVNTCQRSSLRRNFAYKHAAGRAWLQNEATISVYCLPAD